MALTLVGFAAAGTLFGSTAGYATSRPSVVLTPSLVPRPGHIEAPGAAATHLGGSGTLLTGVSACEVVYCWYPGEPVVAVGSSEIVETANTEAAVFNKATGALLTVLPFESFWTGGGLDQCVDPRTIYLPGDDRFAMTCSDFQANVTRFAISQTPDAAGQWYRYAVVPAGDQPKILATSDKFILTGTTIPPLAYSQYIDVYNKADVLAGQPKPALVNLSSVHSYLYQAAVEQTYTADGYFVSSYQCSGCTDDWMATVSGTPREGNVTLSELDLGPNSNVFPYEPPIPGGVLGGNVLDGRVYAAVYEKLADGRRPVIEYSATADCGTATAPRDCILDSRIDLSGLSPTRVYTRFIGQPGWDYTYGAVGLNRAGQVFAAYTRSNAATTPEVAVVGPDFDTVIQPSTSGTTACAETAPPPCNERWGDYLGTAIDPSDPMAVWVTGLYQNSTGPLGWQTVIAKARPGSA